MGEGGSGFRKLVDWYAGRYDFGVGDVASRRRLRLTRIGGVILVLGTAAWIPLQIYYGAWPLVTMFTLIVVASLVMMEVLRRTGKISLVSQVLSLLLMLVITLGNWYGGGLQGANISMFVLVPVGAVNLAGRRGLWWMLPTVLVVLFMQLLHIQGYQFPNVIPPEERTTDSVLTWLTTAVVLGFLIYHYDKAYSHSAAELELARQSAERASQAKSQFVAHISHEIRTPLHGIVGMVELMESEQDPARRKHLALLAQRSADLLLGVLGDILDLSQVEAGKLKLNEHPFDLRADIEQVVGLLRERAASSGTEITVSVDDALPQLVGGDSLRLRQVLLNLVSNAVKFTEQGRISVRVECRDEQPRPGLVQVLVAVSDTGRGISSQDLEHIFEPFYQGQAAPGGTGLGLAISKRLVEMMGGELSVASKLGKGSTFSFTVVLSKIAPEAQVAPEPDHSPETTASPGVAASQPASGFRALLVEDDAVSRHLARVLLERAGAQVEQASKCARAREIVTRSEFDIVFVDLELPDGSGIEVARQLRRREAEDPGRPGHRRTPIVAMTAHAEDDQRQQCLEAGMDEVMVKPFGYEELAGVLRRCLAQPAGKEA